VQVSTEAVPTGGSSARYGAGCDRPRAGRRFAWAGPLVAAAAVAGLVSGCSSASKTSSVAQSPTALTTPTTQPAAPTTSASSGSNQSPTSQLPTVPNCGGGAYEPKTLLIVCGSGAAATTATGVSWAAWGQSQAHGSGTVMLEVNGQATSSPATLELGTVVEGPVGPQFTVLTVTWQGSSPDGKAQDTYHLQLGG
jgi:hypothetical protein